MATIYQAIRNDEELTREQLQLGTPELRKLHSQRGALRIRPDHILEIRVSPNSKPRWCAVCPISLRNALLWQTHGMTHAGISRTLKRLQLTWYWPGMAADTRRVIQTCEVCQSAKQGGTTESRSRQRLYAGRPWQKVAKDFTGLLDTTLRGNKWILAVTDNFTCWSDTIPLPDATAKTIAKALETRIFTYFGVPQILHSD